MEMLINYTNGWVDDKNLNSRPVSWLFNSIIDLVVLALTDTLDQTLAVSDDQQLWIAMLSEELIKFNYLSIILYMLSN